MRTAVAALLVLVACGAKPADAPKVEDRIKTLEGELQKAKDDLVKANAATEDLRKSEAELIKTKADEANALQAKLAAAVGQNGEVTTADGAVKLELVDQILFPSGEADLTPSGKDVLAKVGAALKEIGDKQIWVQGHTDDQPIFSKKPTPPTALDPKAKLAAAKAKKPAKPDPLKANDAVLPFVTNWELSAARSLTVVHYLQDDAKIEPTRLAAVAFGQYRPVSKSRSKNRRIEIVLYPRAKIAPR